MTAEMLLILVGGIGGFFVGRWWSETMRGRFDAERAWRSRRSYRGK